jgi:hypothetical protein
VAEIQKHIISNDGTKIGYRQTGNGEGLIIVHGAEEFRKIIKNLLLRWQTALLLLFMTDGAEA